MPNRFGRILAALAVSGGLVFSSTGAVWADQANPAPAAAPAAAAPATDQDLALGAVTPFPDVPENHWAFEAINQLAQDGFIKGYPDGKFKGARPMTRYEVAFLVSEAVSSLKDSIASGARASQTDIDALKKLLATFGASVADLQGRVARLEAGQKTLSGQVDAVSKQGDATAKQLGAVQTQVNTNQSNALKNTVSFQDVLRAGSLNQFAELRSTVPQAIAGHGIIPPGQVIPQIPGGASALPGLPASLTQAGVGAPSTIYNGSYANGYQYNIMRLNLTGEADNNRWRYALRLEGRLDPELKNGVSQTAPAYCTGLPAGTTASTTVGAPGATPTTLTPGPAGCLAQDYPNPAFNLQFGWAGWYNQGLFVRAGRIVLDEGAYMQEDNSFSGSQQNMVQAGFIGKRLTVEGDLAVQNSGITNAVNNACVGGPCNQTTFGIQGHVDYYFPSTRTDVGFTYDHWSNLPSSAWNAATGSFQTVNLNVNAPDAFIVQYFGGPICPNSTPTFGCDRPKFRAMAHVTERMGTDPFTGVPWVGKFGWYGNLAYSSKGGNWFTGPYYPGKGIKDANVIEAQFFNTGMNGFSADNGTQATTTLNSSFLYPQAGGMVTENIAFAHWFSESVRVGLIYQHYNNQPSVFIPVSGAAACPSGFCFLDSFHANTVMLDTFFIF